LEGPNGAVEDDQGMLKVAVDFYKKPVQKRMQRGHLLGRRFLERRQSHPRREWNLNYPLY
jgi:hypothetical protein